MKRALVLLLWCSAGLIPVAAIPAFAHHSMSMFNLEKTITLQCTVTEVSWANPHSLFFCEGKESDAPDASAKSWSLEAPSPSVMMSKGLKSDTIKVGDKITASGCPRKDGKPSLLMFTITDTTGKRYVIKEPTVP